MKFIPYSRQHINEDDIKAVEEVLRSDFLTTGPMIGKFEESVKNYCGAKHGVALSNGTAALHVALLALGVGEGDIVWTSPISFVASANCALYVGADIDFVDVDIKTGNICLNSLETKLEQAKKQNKLPKAIVIVHFSGRAIDIKAVKKLSDKYGFYTIEDSAHALGGAYENGDKVGSGKYSDATTFSFHPVKSIATGEGGMIMTNNDDLAAKMRLLVCHGITRNEPQMEWESEGAWYYQQVDLGYNYRMTDIQCALGLSQMKRLDEFMKKRNEQAVKYKELLAGLPLDLPAPDANSSWHIYVLQLADPSKRKEFFDYLRAANIGVNVHYIPIHLQPYYKKLGFKAGEFPAAEEFYARGISIPLFPELTGDEQEYIVEKIRGFL